MSYSPYPRLDRGQVRGSVPHKTHGHRLLSLVLAGLVVLVGLGLLGSVQQRAGTPRVSCGATCPRPPVTDGTTPPATFTSSSLGWSLAYDPRGQLQVSTQTATSVEFTVQGYPVLFAGSSAAGRSPQQLVAAAVARTFPQAQLAYAIPGAELGYVGGYGAVYDVEAQTQGGQSQHLRYIGISAVRDGVAVTLQALGPYRASSQSDGHPNPSATPLADLLADPGNSVTWKGGSTP